MKLVIGNKNYSSWSFRPWLAMKVAGISFDEEVISLYVEGSREQILKLSPGEILAAQMSPDGPVPLREHNPDVPPALEMSC